MRGLSLIVASGDGARLYAALETAMAAAALGGRVRMFVQGEAVALLRAPAGFAGDAARRAAGQPDLAQMIEEAAAMEVELIACQSGLALAGLTAGDLVPGARMGGLVGFLAAMDDEERLVAY
ncbi:DsrE family protein [Sphingopyxis indica]|uniref:Predicted peroxiredoxin n=1 Tax=Sphingopyxis indica TaxID=436663 RepID=A0A239HYV5_9SPHN|nr:DsrE family protein [Sphingopyxis indica]SNS86288.1 Predicted peroxiredoxin [Sphingopyxis indica]